MLQASRLIHLTLFFLGGLFFMTANASAQASPSPSSTLPSTIQATIATPLQAVGTGAFRKFGFHVYDATLFAPNGVYDPTKAYALQLVYSRDVSKDTLIDTVADDMEDQHVTDDATFATWKKILNDTLPAVNEGDVMVGVSEPGKNSRLFVNGSQLASLDDPAFSQAFFNVWLGPHADQSLRDKLINKAR